MSLSTVKQAYEPAFEEIARRAQAAQEGHRSGRVVDAVDLPGLEGQDWALLSVGTSVLAPKPLEQEHPALRVYGAFGTREEAAEHGEVLSDVDKESSQIRLRTRSWFMMPQTEEALRDPLAHEERMKERLEQHRKKREEEHRRFDEAVRTHAEHEQKQVSAVQWSEEDEATQEAERAIYTPPRRLRAGAEVRQQGAVVLSVIPDRSGAGECIFCVLGCHETSADAHAWVQKIVEEYVVTTDLVVAHTCEWLFPNGADATQQEHYRNPELQKIMDAAKKNTEGVQRYKAWEMEQTKNDV